LPSPDNIQAAFKIWKKAQTAAGSPIEDYLQGRGLTLAIESYSCALRYHPACPFKSKTVPAMVAAMVNIHTNEFQGIHRTRLNPKDKAMLGTAKGAVVKLTPDEDVTYGLHLCEGIETGLALMQMCQSRNKFGPETGVKRGHSTVVEVCPGSQ
jgi:putative DNA primase/helicase